MGNSDKNSVGNYKLVTRDFSQRAISSALNKYAFGHWSFQYSLIAFLGVVGSTVVFGLTEIIFWGGFAGLVSVLSSVAWNRFFQADKLKIDYITKMRAEIKQETDKKRKRLEEDLINCDCKKGVSQLKALQANYASLVQLLEAKLNEGEVTYERYLGMAQEVFLSGLDNLRKIVMAIRSVDEIDETEIRNELRRISRLRDDISRERAIQLQERLEVKNSKLQKVEALILENEAAITQLVKTASTIDEMDTGLDEGKVDMENSMEQLHRIINRSKKTKDVKEFTRKHQERTKI